MENSENKKSFFKRRVSIWHIIYLIVICLIINIFLLCIIPGRINDDAFHNFSFAATITSIVLAVVSIVYSLQSGISSIGQIESIKEIESKIGREISRFSDLESSIKNAVKEGMIPLENSVGDLQKAQDNVASLLKSSLESAAPIQPKDTSGSIPKLFQEQPIPKIIYIILYSCQRSFETKRPIPMDVFKKHFEGDASYCKGVVVCLSIFMASDITIHSDAYKTDFQVVAYNENTLGKKEWLYQQSTEGKNKEQGKIVVDDIDAYYDTKPVDGAVK